MTNNAKKLYSCDQDDCVFTTVGKQSLKRHKANIHLINVKWIHCSADASCDYKCSTAGAVTN